MRVTGIPFTVEGQHFFRLLHKFNPLLHLIANMISYLIMHEDMQGEYDVDQVPLVV